MIKYLLLIVVFFYSCKNDKPKDLLSEKKMQAVFADIMKIEAYTKNFIEKDTQKNAAVENAKMQLQVFALHKVTKEQFYTSYDYYTADVKKMQGIMDSIINKSNNERFKKTSPMRDPHAPAQSLEE
jgi:hypothetical protein